MIKTLLNFGDVVQHFGVPLVENLKYAFCVLSVLLRPVIEIFLEEKFLNSK